MLSRPALRRLVLAALVPLSGGALSGGLACGTGDDPGGRDTHAVTAEPAAAALLRLRFPAHAAEVLEQGDTLEAGAEGWRRTRADGLSATLLPGGDEAVRLRLPDGFEVRVREEGAGAVGALAGRAVVVPHARGGGASFWAARGGAVEEWLLLDAGRAGPGRGPAASWEVRGATLRQHGDAVALVDDAGAHRIWVTAPAAYAASGRAVTAHLTCTGARLTLTVDAGDEAALIDPLWTTAAPMSVQRRSPTLTTLPGGKVLAAGGFNLGAAALASAELYDPAANLWSPAGAMSSPRKFHTATLVGGKVLVAAGEDGTASLATADLYDPVANGWTPAGAPAAARESHAAALLASGKVLVAGGNSNGAVIKTAEIYDPATNLWAPAASMSANRQVLTLTTLPSGKVLAAGGFSGVTYLGTAEIYDPAGDAWAAAGALPARGYHTATLLPGGKVLVTGGYDGTFYLNGAELYDPAANAWSAGASMASKRAYHRALLLTGTGKVLVTGGYDAVAYTSATEAYDPSSNAWANAGPMAQTRGHHDMAAIGATGSQALVAGGFDGQSALAGAELYTIGLLGTPCSLPSSCASGFCADGVCCSSTCGGGITTDCQACSVAAGATVNGTCATLSGTTCSDGNGCTQTDTCQAGTCVGANPVTCPMPDQCHTAGTCNPINGVCDNPPKPDGVTCDDGNACTQTDTCQAGVCKGASPVICLMPDQCHTAAACNPATGTCSNPTKADGTPCSDGNACTQIDTCQAGVCTGASPMTCPALNQCYQPGVCNPMNGTCSTPIQPNGTPCDDGKACTKGDTCTNGVCSGTTISCSALDTCHNPGFCDATTGMCSNPTKPNGIGCDDGDPCTNVDKCMGGTCVGSSPVTCVAMDECHVAGLCGAGGCSNPPKADGTACSVGVCLGGVCGAGTSNSSSASSSGSSSSGGATSSSGGATSSSGGATSSSGAGGASASASSGAAGTGGATTGTGGTASGGATGSGGASSGTASNGTASNGTASGGATGTGGASSGGAGMHGACGCGAAGSPASGGGVGIGLGLLLMARRRRGRYLASPRA